jgi:hypothetical protein
MSANNYS